MRAAGIFLWIAFPLAISACEGALQAAPGLEGGTAADAARSELDSGPLDGSREDFSDAFAEDGSLHVEDGSLHVEDGSVRDADRPDASVSGSIDIVVHDAAAVIEGSPLVFEVTVTATQGQDITLQTTAELAPDNLTPDQKSMHVDLFAPGEYIANGTVFTRSVANMPLAANSAKIAAYAPTMPAQYLPAEFKDWLVTSLNTVHYNIPVYVVDSTDPSQPRSTFSSTDARVTTKPDLVTHTTGQIPFPTYAYPDTIGDRAAAVYDRGTGMMREYFYLQQMDGSWTFAASGIFDAQPDFGALASDNFFMQLTTGSSAVVAMLNPLSQIGISEALDGEINHALSVTFPNAAAGVISFPAQQQDGTDSNPNAPAQGQWFRIDPTVNIDAMALRPFTKVVAKAIQKYGGYGADKNLWCFAFNAEHPANYMAAGGADPWAAGGAIAAKYGNLDLNDFPWHMTQWAPVSYSGRLSDAAKRLPSSVVVESGATKKTLGATGGTFAVGSGSTTFTVSVPTFTLNGFEQIASMTLKASAGGTSDSGTGSVTDAP